MNNEIKEILDMLKDSQYIPSDDNRTYKLLDRDDTRHLLDYITNLQQLEQEHKKINGELREENSKLEIALQNIQEDYDRRVKENERLKERIAYLERSNNRREDTILGLRQEVYEQEDYKTRCENAIEYIEEMLYPIGTCVNGSDLPYDSIESLLNILQNGDGE